jgi:hypothetical protein
LGDRDDRVGGGRPQEGAHRFHSRFGDLTLNKTGSAEAASRKRRLSVRSYQGTSSQRLIASSREEPLGIEG